MLSDKIARVINALLKKVIEENLEELSKNMSVEELIINVFSKAVGWELYALYSVDLELNKDEDHAWRYIEDISDVIGVTIKNTLYMYADRPDLIIKDPRFNMNESTI